eukprot:89563-Prymnesium_polylepis.1
MPPPARAGGLGRGGEAPALAAHGPRGSEPDQVGGARTDTAGIPFAIGRRRSRRSPPQCARHATHLVCGAQIMQTLPSPVQQARHTAAQVVAAIALIEIPENQWPELITSLVANVTTSGNDAAKQSSLETLGFICEEIVRAGALAAPLPPASPSRLRAARAT